MKPRGEGRGLAIVAQKVLVRKNEYRKRKCATAEPNTVSGPEHLAPIYTGLLGFRVLEIHGP